MTRPLHRCRSRHTLRLQPMRTAVEWLVEAQQWYMMSCQGSDQDVTHTVSAR